MALNNTLSKNSHSSVNYQGLNHNAIRWSSLPYAKKWRIIIALVVGICIIGVCILVFYLSAEAKKPPAGEDTLQQKEKLSVLYTDATLRQWRETDDECLTTLKGACPKEHGNIPVFLLVLGGLRIDQVSEISALQEYVKCGVSANSLVPSYPTFNYPNLYSIATGLYPESHGIVSSHMYDKDLNLNFTVDSPSSYNSGWWRGEPIWNTVGKNGKKSATYLWPGSNIQIQGRYPTYWQKDKVDFVTRIRKVIDWIHMPAVERPDLIMMYYEQPVSTSLHYGPFAKRTVEELRNINVGLDELMTKLNEADLLNCVNIIIASEHGVAASACDNSIYVQDFLEEKIPGRLFTGTVGRIDFDDNADKTVVDKIEKTLQCKKSALRVLKKNEVPIRYHYTNSPRIGDLVLDTRSGYRVATESDNKCLEGEFGYDNSLRSMQGVFIGHGPSFRVGYRTQSFRNVEIYNFLTHLLEVEAAPNNGTKGSLLHLLKTELVKESDYQIPDETFLAESIRPLPVRSNNGFLGKFSEVQKKHISCSCVHEDPIVSTSADVSEAEVSSLSSAEVPSSISTTSTTTESTTAATTTTTSTTTSESTTEFTTSSTTTTTTTSTSEAADILHTSVAERSEEVTTMEEEPMASSISSTKPSSSTESLVQYDETTIISLLLNENSTLDSVTHSALLGNEVSSSAEQSFDEVTTLSIIPAVSLSTGSLSESFSAIEHDIIHSNSSGLESVQETASTTTTTTEESKVEARHVAEIIMAHESSDNKSESNDTVDDIVLEPPHRAEPLVIDEKQFLDIVDSEKGFHHDYSDIEESPLLQEEQNITESSLDEIATEAAPIDDLHNAHDHLLNLTEEQELNNTVEEEHNDVAISNIEDYINDTHMINETEVVEDSNIEARHIDLSSFAEHPVEEEAAKGMETSKLEHTTESVQENLEIAEVTEQLIVDDQQVSEHVKETQIEQEPTSVQTEHKESTPEHHHVHEPHHKEETPAEVVSSLLGESVPEKLQDATEILPLSIDTSPPLSEITSQHHDEDTQSEQDSISAQTEHKDHTPEQHHVHELHQEETPTTEMVSSLMEESVPEEVNDTTEVLPLHNDIIEPPLEETPAGHDDKDKEISHPEISETKSSPEEIEILPIPESLKSLSLVKDSRNVRINESLLQKFHCPWGFPRLSAPEVASDTVNILLHSSHIIGLPESLNLPVWTSFTMSKERLDELNKARPEVPEGVYISPEERRNNMPVGCWISDSRLQRSSSDQCSRTFQTDLYKAKNASLRQLFPENLEIPDILNKEGYLLSNLAPVMKGYEEGARNLMINSIQKWTKQMGPVNIVHGPVFDYDFDGRRDDITVIRNTIKPLIPSGYFFVATVCNETKDSESSESQESEESTTESFKSCPLADLNVYSFVFPNTEHNDMCLMSDRDYLLYHLASLADVEDLTSLTFFRHMDHKSRDQLRARQHLRILSI